ncbi:MAG TPA: helix-turn-helix transcriptional regulator [Ktedonobacteraceae bacterium]|jgi:DNA-binding Xre family transcriptional regulator|nr:helix-turn-helix transcriptional regulator [Ktedonobacteraceae bacterium]
MTISCHLRLLVARVNVERARQGLSALSLRRLADETEVSLSVLTALNMGRSQRIDYHTLDRLLNYFNQYFTVTMNDLLVWEVTQVQDTAVLG